MDRAGAQDFFFDLTRESQRARAAHLAERERWIRTLEIVGREEILFELEMLLRGLDRFFNLRVLFGLSQPEPQRDFREELRAARDALHRAIHLGRRLMAQKQEQALLFRSFVEGAVSDERGRAKLGTDLREQRTPEESLFLLRGGLTAYLGILDHLLRLDSAPQSAFLDVGRALQHELFVSRFFCPATTLEFRSEYDRIGSVRLLEVLRAVQDEKKRRAFAVAWLAAFRALRTLRYVPAPPAPHTRRVLVVLALTRSELSAIVGYLEEDLPRLCATVESAPAIAAAGRAAAVPLRAVLEQTPAILAEPLTDRAQLDSHRDRLVEATKDSVGALATALDPALSRQALFEGTDVRLEESERLRTDLYVFRELCLRCAGELQGPDATLRPVHPLRQFALEFRDIGYQLLRHSDRELFDRFLDLLDRAGSGTAASAAPRAGKLREDCRRFADILDRAIENVAKRSELRKVPIDDGAVRDALARHLRSR